MHNPRRVKQLYRVLVLVLLASLLPVAPMPATPIRAAPESPDLVTLDTVATRLATLPTGLAGIMADAVPETFIYLLGGYRTEAAQGGGIVKTLSRDIYRYDAVLDHLAAVDELPTGWRWPPTSMCPPKG